MLAGVAAIFSLPIAQYPTIAPPSIQITANYPGASAKTVEYIDGLTRPEKREKYIDVDENSSAFSEGSSDGDEAE